MSHVSLLGWLISLLLKTTRYFLKCYFYLLVYSFNVTCSLVGVYGFGLWVRFYVCWMQEVTSRRLPHDNCVFAYLGESFRCPCLQKPNYSVPLSQWFFGAVIMVGRFS